MSVLLTRANNDVIDLGAQVPTFNGVVVAVVSAWVRPAISGAAKSIIGFSIAGASPTATPRMQVFINFGTLRFRGRCPDSGATRTPNSALAVNDGNWHHVLCAVSYALEEVHFSVDGGPIVVKSVSFGANISDPTDSASAFIGADTDGSGRGYDGDLFDVRVYTDVPMPDQAFAQTLANSRGRDSLFNGLQHRYMLNEGAPGVVVVGADTIKDQGVRGVDGTPINTPAYSEALLGGTSVPVLS